MIGFIFEGPDGSGKSFTAEKVALAVGLPIHHSGGPPKNHVEIFNRALLQAQLENVVLDRSVIITDMIYSPTLRGEVLFGHHWLKLIKLPVVYCRPSRETILSSQLQTKPHKSEAHLQSVKQQINSIIDAYDRLMTKIPHIHFNRDKQTCAELIALLENPLSNK